ncbi:MAG TPA: NfeD family protein [Pyrinomonadaceae bacterium]|nr:NfeD family protein [Pyrinomonadaceae bacterium]
MEEYAWIFWVIVGVSLIVAEVFTFGFVLFWFGLGALAAALVGFLGFGYLGQFLTFLAVSGALTAMSRTIFSNYMWGKGNAELKIGADALPGKIGTVVDGSKGALNAASVNVYGSEWTAFPADEQTVLTSGEKVEVVRVEGTRIYVRPSRKEMPGWKQD